MPLLRIRAQETLERAQLAVERAEQLQDQVDARIRQTASLGHPRKAASEDADVGFVRGPQWGTKMGKATRLWGHFEVVS